jgi:hypothetical protein
MAARFAAQVNAKQLVLTHFSSRYHGDASLFAMQVTMLVAVEMCCGSVLFERTIQVLYCRISCAVLLLCVRFRTQHALAIPRIAVDCCTLCFKNWCDIVREPFP